MVPASEFGRSGSGGAAEEELPSRDDVVAGKDAAVDPAVPALSHGFGGAADMTDDVDVDADADAGQKSPFFPETGQARLGVR